MLEPLHDLYDIALLSLRTVLKACCGLSAALACPAHELAMMMTIALRFIPTLLEETDRIMKAQMSRGADFSSGNLVQRAKESAADPDSSFHFLFPTGR